jgi:pyruvate/2-oxoacid:ferredoxin oxidoreductase alpha subunit/Pyruvate/2-oxoacid:ferredoxin oxidoreductase gamma subunit
MTRSASALPASALPASALPASGVNDFAFKIATVNGTGSASANSLLMQSIFRMGIPVSGKNIFPSNIQGLPTWYEIRVSKDGYTARPPEIDLVVALNTGTYEKDIATVRPGGCLLYDSSWPLEESLLRDDITVLGIPFGKMCVEAFQRDRDRTLLRNITYVGALAALLEIEMDVIHEALSEKFGKKKALLDANFTALRLGYDYVKANFQSPLPFHLERMNANADYVLMDGNTAAALGAVYAGATVGAWYPITPATSLMEAFTMFCNQYRVDPVTKEKKFCIIQAEDELSAAGIVIGANWAGARSFTSTAGPGISLMQEFIGLAYYTETPAVIFDVQRTGPSTGMPTRTLPGVSAKGSYFTRGSGHDKLGNYTEDSVAYQEVMDRLVRKLANAAKAVPAPDMHMDKLSTTNNIGIVGIGGCHAAIREAVDVLRGESYAVDYMRICGFPFDQPVAEFIGTHQTVFVVEQNRDAQLRSLLAIEFGVPRDHMISILDYNGLPLTSQVVVDAVTNHLAGVAV